MTRSYSINTRSTAAVLKRRIDRVNKHIQSGNLLLSLPSAEVMDIRMRSDARTINRCNKLVVHTEDVLYAKHFYDEQYNGDNVTFGRNSPLTWDIGFFLEDKGAITIVQYALSLGFNAYIVSGRDNAVLLHDRRQSAYERVDNVTVNQKGCI